MPGSHHWLLEAPPLFFVTVSFPVNQAPQIPHAPHESRLEATHNAWGVDVTPGLSFSTRETIGSGKTSRCGA